MLLFLFVLGLLIFGIPRLITEVSSMGKIHTVEESPAAPVGIVFGAGLNRDGSPSPVLRHRVQTAVDLYFAGKISKILMSGDNRFVDYNEPAAMYEYAVELGLPAEDVVLDYAGRRTYDTCYRARDIFQVNDVLLITQRFHLPRALFICRQLGLDAQGVSANQVQYRKLSQIIWNTREIPATLVAFIELFITRPLPVLGDPEPIFNDNLNS